MPKKSLTIILKEQMKEFLIERMKNDYPKERTFIQRECYIMAEDYAREKMDGKVKLRRHLF